jgi:hypothetical protein
MPDWSIAFDAQHPEDPTRTWKIGIRKGFLEGLHARGHESRIATARLIQGCVLPPEVLIGGWGRGKGDCLVYVGCPGHDFRTLSIECSPPPGRAFLVFVLPDGTIDDWGWREVEKQGVAVPRDMKGTIIWPPH